MNIEDRYFVARWHPASDPPKEEGEYLVARNFLIDSSRYDVDVMSFGKIGRKKKVRCAWYVYGEALDKIDCDDEVVAWMELPEYRKGK